MVEQKPEQPKSQLETNDPQEYSARGKGFFQRVIGEKISRRIIVPTAIMLGGLAGGSAVGCGDETSPSETSGQTVITQPTTSENPTTLGTIPNDGTTGTTDTEKTTTSSHSTTTTEIQKPDRLMSYKILDSQFMPSELRKAIENKTSNKVEKIAIIDAFDPHDYSKNMQISFFDAGDNNMVAFKNPDGSYVIDYISVSPVIDRNLFKFSLGARIGSDFIAELVLDYKKEDGESGEQFAKRTYDLFFGKLRFPGELKQELLANTKEIILTDPFNGQKVTYSKENPEEIEAFIKASGLGESFYERVSGENENKEITKEDVLQFVEGLIGNTTLEELKQYTKLPLLKRVNEGQFNVSNEIQKAYQQFMPNESILFVGDPSDMSGKTWLPSRPFLNTDKYELPVNGFGVMRSASQEEELYVAMVGVFKEVVVVSFDENNKYKEFLLVFEDPTTKRLMPVRINFEPENNTGLNWVYNLQKKEQEAVLGAKQKFINQIQLNTNLKLNDILISDAPYLIMFNARDENGKTKNVFDENGFRKIRSIVPFAANDEVASEIFNKF